MSDPDSPEVIIQDPHDPLVEDEEGETMDFLDNPDHDEGGEVGDPAVLTDEMGMNMDGHLPTHDLGGSFGTDGSSLSDSTSVIGVEGYTAQIPTGPSPRDILASNSFSAAGGGPSSSSSMTGYLQPTFGSSGFGLPGSGLGTGTMRPDQVFRPFGGNLPSSNGFAGDVASASNSGSMTMTNGYGHASTGSSKPIEVDEDEGSPEVEVVGESRVAVPTAAPAPGVTSSGARAHEAVWTGTVQGFGYGQTYPSIASSSSSTIKPEVIPPANPSTSTSAAPIDLTDDTVADRYAQPAAPISAPTLDMTDRRPVCIGSIDTQALILYPISMMQKGSGRDELIRANELRVDQGGEEWLKVKLKFRKGKGVGAQGSMGAGADGMNGPSADSVINIMSSKQTVIIGVLNVQAHGMFSPLMAKGLIRLEGYIKRGKLENMFTAVLNVVCFTLPSNVLYIASYLAESSQFLDHPLPYYIPENHFDAPVYYNPHNPPPEGFRAIKRNRLDMMIGRGAAQQQKTIDVQRDQVDQVFMALPSHDELPETNPGDMIKTKLFPHQLKAITFLQQRESEAAAIKAATAASLEDQEVVDVDAEMTEEEKKKQIKRMKKKAEKDAKKKGVNSLWVPEYDSSGKKIKGWKHMVTEEVHKGKDKPAEARGAILADEMGLGKTLSIVSLIASTLPSARKFAQGSTKDEPSDSGSDGSDSDDKEDNVDISSFSRYIPDMPVGDASSKKRKRETGFKFTAQKIAKLERKGRLDRLRLKSRATLLICPLSTVSNWEEQIRDHWRGKVHVVGAAAEKGKKTDKPMPEKGDLKIYIYHGNSRKNDLDFLADFDVVITTFSVLQTEYSKQIKTAEGEKTYLQSCPIAAAASSAATPIASDYSAEDQEAMDIDGPNTSRHERPEVRAERLSLQRGSADGKKRKNADQDLFGKKTANEVVSPLQAVEWFRVVLDEAHFIKDPTTVVSRAACYLEAERRICLSGTPIQNKLDDIWALFKFLRLAPFDKREVWNKNIMDYAKAGNSLGVVRLQTILKHCTLRRTKDSVNDSGNKILDLPPRKEVIVQLELQEEERKVYDQHFLQGQKQFNEADQDGKVVDVVNILQQILRLRQICDHPTLLESCSVEDLEEEILADGLMDLETAKRAIEHDGLNLRRALAYIANLRPEEPAACVCCQAIFNISDIVKDEPEGEETPAKPVKGAKRKGKTSYPIMTRCCHLFCLGCFKKEVFPDWPKNAVNSARTCGSCNRALRLGREVIEVSPGSTVLAEGAESKSRAKRRRKVDDDFVYSAKMVALLNDLLQNSVVNPNSENYDPHSANAEIAEMDETGQPLITKSVVFSQWTSMLDLLEGMLEKNSIGCARLDGTMKREDRTEAMERLKSDGKCEVLLVSLRAGGVGLNLVTASRCYLIDPYWNPAVEAQAIDRVHRLGQKRNVVATRYLIKNSIEETMLKIQERKRELANMSLSQSLSKKELHDRKMDDLREIFKK